MPRITFRDYLSEERGQHVGEAAEAVARGFRDVHADKQRQKEIDLRQRHLQIEEDRAKASLLQESNRAKILGAREAAADADREAAVQGLQELAGQKRRDAVEKGVAAAIRSPGGALGPFGAIVGATTGAGQVELEMGPKIELARRMSPAGAQRYLAKETAEAKQQTIAQAYQREAEAVMAGVQDGVLTPEMAKGMTEALQLGLRSGALPGKVHAQVAKAYDMHAKVQKRIAGWEESDRKAGEAISMLETMAKNAEGDETRAKLLKMVADAKGEWGRTLPPSFREKNDGAASLAGLEKIVFGAEAAQGDMPSAIQYTDPAAIEAKRQADMAQAVGPVGDRSRPRQTSKPAGLIAAGNIDLSNRPRVRNADGSISTVRSMSFEEDGQEILVPMVSDDGKILTDDQAIDLYHKTGKHLGKFKDEASATAYAKKLHEQQAATLATPPTAVPPEAKVDTGKKIAEFVSAHGRVAMEQGTPFEARMASIKKIRLDLAKELGLDPRDPYLEGAVTEALKRMQRGELAAPAEAAPKGPRRLMNLAPQGARPGSGLGPGGM